MLADVPFSYRPSIDSDFVAVSSFPVISDFTGDRKNTLQIIHQHVLIQPVFL